MIESTIQSVSSFATSVGKLGGKCAVTGGYLHLSAQQARATLCKVARPVSRWLYPRQMWFMLGALFILYGLLNLVAIQWLKKVGKIGTRVKRSRLGLGPVFGRRTQKVTRRGTVYG